MYGIAAVVCMLAVTSRADVDFIAMHRKKCSERHVRVTDFATVISVVVECVKLSGFQTDTARLVTGWRQTCDEW